LKDGWRSAGIAAGMMVAAGLAAFLTTPARNTKRLEGAAG
jgi:hypothetical protein